MTDTGNRALLIFIKNPVRGKVKTRLAKTLGEAAALQVYLKLLTLTRRTTEKVNCTRQLWYSNSIEWGDQWSEEMYEKRLQNGSDLGERMQNAFKKVFKEGYEKIIVIGSDCAELCKDHIDRAFLLLDQKEVVVGPSADGGYYLLGMNKFYPELFDEKSWSTPVVYQETVGQLKRQGITFGTLPMLNDIDTEKDLIKSGQRLRPL